MRIRTTFILIFFSSFLISQNKDLTLSEIINCAKKNQTKSFVKNITAKNYFFLRTDSTKEGVFIYYALNKDSNSVLITIKSYNVVDLKISELKQDQYKNLLKELASGYKTICYGGFGAWREKPEYLKDSTQFHAYSIDKVTKLIAYKEDTHKGISTICHIVIASIFLDNDIKKYTKQERKNCLQWLSICSEFEEGEKIK